MTCLTWNTPGPRNGGHVLPLFLLLLSFSNYCCGARIWDNEDNTISSFPESDYNPVVANPGSESSSEQMENNGAKQDNSFYPQSQPHRLFPSYPSASILGNYYHPQPPFPMGGMGGRTQKRMESYPHSNSGREISFLNANDDLDSVGRAQFRPLNYNLHRLNFAGGPSFGGGGGGGIGRHSSGFMRTPVAPRKRQILFRQCFFNPISCF